VKSQILSKPMMAFVVMMLCGQIAPILVAQNSAPAPAKTGVGVTASASDTRTVELSSSVSDILKLSRAQVSDETITAFIKNSGKTYHLSASEILYLREQGVSDPVVTVMLDKRTNVAATVAQAEPQPVSEQPAAPTYNASPQPATAYVAAAPTYVQPSTVYVYPPASYGYYDAWPYRGGYWGYPALSFSFGFGGGYYHGGYHGGGHYGGRSGGGGHH